MTVNISEGTSSSSSLQWCPQCHCQEFLNPAIYSIRLPITSFFHAPKCQGRKMIKNYRKGQAGPCCGRAATGAARVGKGQLAENFPIAGNRETRGKKKEKKEEKKKRWINNDNIKMRDNFCLFIAPNWLFLFCWLGKTETQFHLDVQSLWAALFVSDASNIAINSW